MNHTIEKKTVDGNVLRIQRFGIGYAVSIRSVESHSYVILNTFLVLKEAQESFAKLVKYFESR